MLLVALAAGSCSEDLPVQNTFSPGDEPGASGGPNGSGRTGTNSNGTSNGANGTAGSGTNGGRTGTGSGANGTNPAGGGSSMGAGGIPACMGLAGQYVCDKSRLVKCDAAGNAEKPPEQCGSVAQCEAGRAAGACGACDPGAFVCSDAALSQCSMAGKVEPLQMCDSPALCDEMTGKCNPKACEPEAFKCDGDNLFKCSDDLTELTMVEPCEAGLCDEAAKKCNDCVPNSQVCGDEETLLTCSATGEGPAMAACPDPTPKCKDTKCVQCLADEDCTPPNDCQAVACVENACAPPTPKPAQTPCTEGGKVCDGAGACVECVADADCPSASQACLNNACVERAPLVVGFQIRGRQTVTLNATYELRGTLVGASRVTVNTVAVGDNTLIAAASNEVQTFNAVGPAMASCPSRRGVTTATLEFATIAAMPDAMPPTENNCGALSAVNLRAIKK